MEIKSSFWQPSEMSGFLLDWDGVIAETKLDFNAIRERYYGSKDAMLLEDACTLTAKDRKSLMKDLQDLEVAGAKKAVPVDGAFELLKWLDKKGIPYCIISRNCARSIELAAKNIGLKLPECEFNRDNSEYIKPDPRALAAAAHAIGVEPSRCVLVGDYIYDLQGARRAGMRAVLVQRNEPGWDEWADAVYPTLSDFVTALNNNTPLVPWEYREIFSKRGEKWLNAAHELVLQLPETTSPTIDCWLARAALLGVGTISVSDGLVFAPNDWKSSPSMQLDSMGCSVVDVARDFLLPRFPMTNVVAGDDGLKAPKNSLDLMRFIERKIYK
jgi:HAD superfamily hydrolase (TIGR01509 family)